MDLLRDGERLQTSRDVSTNELMLLKNDPKHFYCIERNYKERVFTLIYPMDKMVDLTVSKEYGTLENHGIAEDYDSTSDSDSDNNSRG